MKLLRQIKSGIKFKKPILALGGELKANFCIAKNNFLFFSNSFGDLEDPRNLEMFEKGLRNSLKSLKAIPKIIAYDLHPEYLSSKLARELGPRDTTHIGVQHHHAHIASCMFDNNIYGKVIGICFDGTGFGLDGNLWGAEFLMADFSSFKRVAHLEYIPLVGGAKAIEEPYRVAFAWLYKIYKDKLFKLNIDFVKRLDKANCQVFKQMLKNNFNCPLSSSIGRLFDSISSLLGLADISHFEAEPAMKLEKIADLATRAPLRRSLSRLAPRCLESKRSAPRRAKSRDSGQASHPAWPAGRQVAGYSYKINLDNGIYIIDPKPMFKDIIKDLGKKVSVNEIALKFHYAVIGMMKDTCRLIRRKTRLNTVVLSGGVFQNQILREGAIKILEKEGFKVFSHAKFSTTDASISLGQALIANKLYREV